MDDLEMKVRDLIEDYFYEKTKDVSFNYYEEQERRQELDDIAQNCIDEVRWQLKQYDNDIDEFLTEYELNREADLKEYEWKLKNREY